tara:strand:+ start:6703 stop:7080 length:378 start_codon:yes stop_codon:yes gene_type:complete
VRNESLILKPTTMSKIEEARDKIAELTDKLGRRDKHIVILEELRDVLKKEALFYAVTVLPDRDADIERLTNELSAEKQKNEELKKGVEEISNQNKYKQVGDRDSYSSYNEGWQDCIDSVEQLLNK